MMKLLFLSLALVFTQTAFAHPHQHPHPDPQNASRLYLHELGFFPTGPGCFERAPQHILPGHTFEAIQSGGVAVYTSQGVRVMTGFDPLYLSFGMSRIRRNDMFVSSYQGYKLFPRYGHIPYGDIEVFQRPMDAYLCY
jgi:hypothetical protein